MIEAANIIEVGVCVKGKINLFLLLMKRNMLTYGDILGHGRS